MKCDDILEYFRFCLGLSYISDLKYLPQIRKDQIFIAANHLSVDDFPVEQWQEAVRYLTGKDAEDLTPSEAKALILACMK